MTDADEAAVEAAAPPGDGLITPEFTITLRGSDIHAIAKHISSIETTTEEAAKPLTSLIIKLVQVFARRNDDFDAISFVSECGFGADKQSPLLIAANALHMRATMGKPITMEQMQALALLSLSALSSEPMAFDDDPTFEPGASAGGPLFEPNKDWAYVIKPGSKYYNQGPFQVISVDSRKNSVTLLINNTRQDYKSYNLRKR
jgi:hypothetical protein